MPHRHTIKTFVENSYYHVYNRGVEKRKIFLDDQDYRVFIHLLKYYLSPNPQDNQNKHPITEVTNIAQIRPRPLANLGENLELIGFCLMPNHFHLLIKQFSKDGLTQLMRRLLTTYSMYFNKRYKRVGYLFQGRYKAVLITDDRILLHISRYIHLNPKELTAMTRTDLVNYPYSSYSYYLDLKHADWIKPLIILKFFDNTDKLPFLLQYPSYKKFVEGSEIAINTRKIIGSLSID